MLAFKRLCVRKAESPRRGRRVRSWEMRKREKTTAFSFPTISSYTGQKIEYIENIRVAEKYANVRYFSFSIGSS